MNLSESLGKLPAPQIRNHPTAQTATDNFGSAPVEAANLQDSTAKKIERPNETMKLKLLKHSLTALTVAATTILAATPAHAADKKPNILFIMGDDIGMWNIGAYHRGMMAGRTPALDKLAKEGMLFTDYYAEASCTAGRANFITGGCRSAPV